VTQRTTILAGAGVGVAVGLVILAIVWMLTSDGDAGTVGTEAGAAAAAGDVPAAGELVGDRDLQPVVLFFPGGDEVLLRPETREIYWTALLTDRARQVLAEFLRGPEVETRRPVVPASLALKEVYVLPGGNAWVDLTWTAGRSLAMGSLEERAVVEGIALSLTANFPEIRRVGILIDGEQVESLAGHVDLRATYTGREWLPPGARLDDLIPAEVREAREKAAEDALPEEESSEPT
jgi:hypothetical protein